MAVPCAVSYVSFDGIYHNEEEDACNWDKEAAIEYIGETLNFKVLYN